MISNKLGLHARAAAKFVRIASGFQSEIMIHLGSHKVSGKSIMGIMIPTRNVVLSGSVVISDDHFDSR